MSYRGARMGPLYWQAMLNYCPLMAAASTYCIYWKGFTVVEIW
jgi:hypothetical protein